MRIKVSTNNERIFYPDLFGNFELEQKDQFGIKVKKLSLSLHSDKWAKSFDNEEDKISIDFKKYVQAHVIDFVNPPILQDNDKEIEMTVNILFSDSYNELYPIIEGLLAFINKMYEGDTEEDVKK